MIDPRKIVSIPRGINRGLSSAKSSTMLQVLGMPRDKITSSCKSVNREPLKSLIVTQSVGPFRVTGIRPAVDSLREILSQVKRNHPEVYNSLGTAGMLCVRTIRNSQKISNHSWGCAVDISIDGILDPIHKGGTGRKDKKTLAGLVAMAPYFNRAGWYWGVGFSSFEDGMHFEVADETIRKWNADGVFGHRPSPVNPSVLRRGDRGMEVRRLQSVLNQHGYKLKTDGNFGAITEAAVTDFQRARRLTPDGIVGRRTWAALKKPQPVEQAPIPASRRPILSLGAKGPQVTYLQRKLNEHGQRLSVDGDFGPGTRRAVIGFQGSRNLVRDGIVGAKTWAALANEKSAPQSNPINWSAGKQTITAVVNAMPSATRRANSQLETHVTRIIRFANNEGLSREQTAYVLATTITESQVGLHMLEFSSGQDYEGSSALGNTQRGDGPRYKGRGYVQITGRRNYTDWAGRLGIDLVGNPSLAEQPHVAVQILVRGMTGGTFTGRRLDRYVNADKIDFYNARRVVNGVNKAREIERYAVSINAAIVSANDKQTTIAYQENNDYFESDSNKQTLAYSNASDYLATEFDTENDNFLEDDEYVIAEYSSDEDYMENDNYMIAEFDRGEDQVWGHEVDNLA